MHDPFHAVPADAVTHHDTAAPHVIEPDSRAALESLTLDELRARVRELYDAQRGVERERESLRAAQQAFAAERRAFLAQHETALRRSEQRLRTIFETEPDCVKVITAEGDLLEINECGVALFEADDIAHLKAIRITDRILPAYRDAFMQMHTRALTGEPGRLEFEIEGLRGTRRWIETHAAAMRDAESGETVVLSICRDISAQKAAVKALVRNETIVTQISATLPFGFLVIDDRTNDIVHANQQFCDLFGIPELHDAIQRGEYSAKQALEYCGHMLRDADAMFASCAALADVENRSIVSDEIAFNDDRTIRRYSSQIRDDEDRYVGRFYLFEDITARHHADRERARLETQLHQAMKMQSVGRLAGGVAHDFNNMLGVIIGHAEVAMRATRPADPVHIDLAAIHKAAERSAGLTRQLLAFASKQAAEPKRLDLNESVGNSLRMLQRLISEDVRLQWRPESTLWPVCIDPSQVDQILTNLCVNARDAIANVGTVTIETANCRVEARQYPDNPDVRPGEFVRLSVTDDGCGMDAATVAMIFEPFFTTKRIGTGTGLGLATVYGTVKQNDGFITVDSAPGAGTTFSIYLPRYNGAEAVQPAEAAQPATPHGRETVLLVEDEPAILTLVAHILSGQGYHVMRANSPKEALQIADAHVGKIDLLLTDVIMPDMNGRDLAVALRSRYPDVRAVFMSGYTSDVIAKHGVLDDGVLFLQKPFSIDSLSGKVREALDRDA